MMIDTHCHIHESGFYENDREEVYARAIAADVAMMCVGTSEQSSREAVDFVARHDDTWAIIGVHPHEAKDGWSEIEEILRNSPLPSLPISEKSARRSLSAGPVSTFAPSLENHGFSKAGAPPRAATRSSQVESTQARHSEPSTARHSELDSESTTKIVGIGEIGLDYFYNHSPREVQIRALEAQLQLAVDHGLPVSFHVREAYDDFWPIFANFPGIRGVLHSFTDSTKNLEKALSEGLYIGINGISTFARDKQAMFDAVPLENMLLETDAPFLTPVPLRGKINEPAFVRNVAEYHAERRHIALDEISAVTSANARRIFSI